MGHLRIVLIVSAVFAAGSFLSLIPMNQMYAMNPEFFAPSLPLLYQMQIVFALSMATVIGASLYGAYRYFRQ